MISTRAALAHSFSSLPRIWRTLKVVSAFFWFWFFAVLLAGTVFPWIALVGRDSQRRMRRAQKLIARAFGLFHSYMRWLGLIERRLVGEIERPASRPVIFVANHTTLIDVTAIMSLVPHVCCLAKSAFASSLVLGRPFRLCGFIGSGTDLRSRGLALQEAETRLREGFDLLVFPEGTRSPPGGLLPFHRGAFVLACRTGAPIVPLLMHCAPSALTKDRPFFYQPEGLAQLSIEPMSPCFPEAHEMDASRLRDHVIAEYQARIPRNVKADG
jgi:1-acyl-sn-glycerol-3-phosphate acyltransferase